MVEPIGVGEEEAVVAVAVAVADVITVSRRRGIDDDSLPGDLSSYDLTGLTGLPSSCVTDTKRLADRIRGESEPSMPLFALPRAVFILLDTAPVVVWLGLPRPSLE